MTVREVGVLADIPTKHCALAALALAAFLAAVPAAVPAAAQEGAPNADPDWPCIQRKVPHLSLGQVWAGPVPDDAVKAAAKLPEIDALARQLAVRRTSLEEAGQLIDAFAADHDATALGGLYLATFQHIDAARDRIVSGIGRYARKQAALDDEIRDKRHELDRLTAGDPQDFDAIDAAEQAVDWSLRIFQDRQQSLTYVCETPVILEQRAFALGRAVAAHLPKPQ